MARRQGPADNAGGGNPGISLWRVSQAVEWPVKTRQAGAETARQGLLQPAIMVTQTGAAVKHGAGWAGMKARKKLYSLRGPRVLSTACVER